MKKITLLLAAAALLCSCNCNRDKHLPRAINDSLAPYADSVFQSVPLCGSVNELHSLIVVQDGKVVYEKYAPGHNASDMYGIWSASKTFTATAVGFAVQDGLLSLDDKVLDYFKEEMPVITDSLQIAWYNEMTLRDLIVMSSGFEHDYLAKVGAGVIPEPAKEILSNTLVFEPGSRFSYNSMNTYLLSAIITKVTGKMLEDYLEEKLFRPLGIREHLWEVSTEGYNFGGWGLHITTESFVKEGMLFLQNGMWDGKQLINQEWIKEATSPQIDTEKAQGAAEWKLGYGYQMWMCSKPGCTRIDGAWSQFCVIYPDKNAVVAVNAHSWGSSQLLDALMQYIYPNL